MKIGREELEKFLEPINEFLETILFPEDIGAILDITDSIGDDFKNKIVEGQDVKDKRVYCIILKEDIPFKLMFECLRHLVITNDGMFLFFKKDMELTK